MARFPPVFDAICARRRSYYHEFKVTALAPSLLIVAELEVEGRANGLTAFGFREGSICLGPCFSEDLRVVAALSTIAKNMRQLPAQLNAASAEFVASCGGKLLLESISLGAFAGPEWILLRYTIDAARRGQLPPQDGRLPGVAEPKTARSPSPEWHVFVNGYDAILLARNETGGAFDAAFVRRACLGLADLIDAEVKAGCWIWPLRPLHTADLGNRLYSGTDAVPGQVVTITVRRSRPAAIRRHYEFRDREQAVHRWTDSYRYYTPTGEDLAIVQANYPGLDPRNPSWARIEADLLAGHKPDDLIALKPPALLQLLISRGQTKAQSNAAGSRELAPDDGLGIADRFGYVESPSDPSAYVSASKILSKHTSELPNIGAKELTAIVKNYAENRVRWTRPPMRSGEPRPNRLNVHLNDWLRCAARLKDPLLRGRHPVDPTPDKIERGKAAIRRSGSEPT